MARELDMTRLDYNELTSRLRQQVCDLLDAKMELTALNETLESKVAQRTAELEAANAEVERQRAAALAERDAAFAALDDEVAQVSSERATAVEGIDAGLVTLYEKLRGQLSGRGAAALVGRQCQGCRMELNPTDLDAIRSAPPDQVVRCEECGRILVRTDR